MRKIAIILLTLGVLLSCEACQSGKTLETANDIDAITNMFQVNCSEALTSESPAMTHAGDIIEIHSEAPTPEPTSLAVDEHDYSVLKGFFEQKDESGIRNGEKLFPDYNPDDVNTWYDGSESYDNVTQFNNAGKVRFIKFTGKGEEPVHLAGKLVLSELDSLETFRADNTVLLEVDAADLAAAKAENGIKISIPMVEGEAVLTAACTLDGIYLRSASHTVCNITGETEGRINLVSFRIEVKTEGEGYAGVSAVDGENSYMVKLVAEPMEGKTFVGWFDADGKLVFSDAMYELFGEQSGNLLDVSHVELSFTARFE